MRLTKGTRVRVIPSEWCCARLFGNKVGVVVDSIITERYPWEIVLVEFGLPGTRHHQVMPIPRAEIKVVVVNCGEDD